MDRFGEEFRRMLDAHQRGWGGGRLAMLREVREALCDAPLDGDQWQIVENALDRLEAAERAKGADENL